MCRCVLSAVCVRRYRLHPVTSDKSRVSALLLSGSPRRCRSRVPDCRWSHVYRWVSICPHSFFFWTLIFFENRIILQSFWQCVQSTTCAHIMASSSSPMLTATGLFSGKWQRLTFYGIDTPNQSPEYLLQVIISAPPTPVWNLVQSVNRGLLCKWVICNDFLFMDF